MAAGIESARIAFAGTPEFAVPTLAMLVAAGAAVPLVLTQPDRPAGRGRKLLPSPVKRLALERGLRVEQPQRLDDPRVLADWGDVPEILLVVAYGLLLPAWLLDWPTRGCLNLHASLLPRWRGAAPIQHAILAGDSETGVSLMQMERGLDTGPVYAHLATPIGGDETAASLHDRLSRLGAELAREQLPAILAGRVGPTPQPDAGVTLAPKIAKSDAALDWRRDAAALARQVRAFDPWPVAEAKLSDGRRLRIWEAIALTPPLATPQAERPPLRPPAEPPGVIVACGQAGIDVATGRGLLRLTKVQPPGAKAMPAAAYLTAHTLTGVQFVVA